MKRSNKVTQALHLPKVLNLNPRSAMNKTEEISTFIEEEDIDIAFISESHDRENKRLEDHIKLEDHVVISNLSQRPTKEKGGRPALIVNKKKYHVENLTNTQINIPWGVELTWAAITPKVLHKDSVIKRIVLGAIYVKPSSRKKTATIDHIAEVYSTLNTKYGRGTFWIIAGDTNNLKLGPILTLNSKLKSVVKKPTRMNQKNPQKSSILDNIITDLHKWYQEPKCLPAIAADPGKGKPSDHLTVLYLPINVINNLAQRSNRRITVRPITQSGIQLFGLWIKSQSWEAAKETCDVNKKTEYVFDLLKKQALRCLPTKIIKVSSDDSPWVNEHVKNMKRSKCREYKKNRKSKKWQSLQDKYLELLKKSKNKYYNKIIKDLKDSNPSQWYSKLKRICSYDQEKFDPIVCEEIEKFTNQEQADKLAEYFSKVRNEYEPLEKETIHIPNFTEDTIPKFKNSQVKEALSQIKPKKSVPPGDIPAIVLKTYSDELAEPIADIINTSIKQGIWPKIFKIEHITPVPKIHPPKLIKNLRSLSGLMTLNKIQEKLISELIVSDIESSLDPSQYSNQKGLSIQHYLINMIHKILSDAKSCSTEITAVLATLIDWKDAFPKQDPKLGVEAFIKCGVRPSLIPVLINYFQGRSMVVKWNGELSKEINLNGGGPQGGYFGILEYLTQSNSSANCVKPDSRFKFMDDLTILEKINLILIGMTSYNSKFQVPNDMNESNLYIPSENLKSQTYLNEIEKWTQNQKMELNENKTKVMIFNFTRKKQFSTRLTLNNKIIETIKETKLLGTIITDNLKWNKNTKFICKKAYARMQLLQKIRSFTSNIKDLIHIYKTFVRSVAEQSCVVWNSSLTRKNIRDLERIQKVAVKLIIGNRYEYQEALQILNLPTMKTRRKMLTERFAVKCVKNKKTSTMFQQSNTKHKMKLRKTKKYHESKALTRRFQISAIPTMQKILNKIDK